VKGDSSYYYDDFNSIKIIIIIRTKGFKVIKVPTRFPFTTSSYYTI
jgi:hypothetical protein